MLAMLVVLWQWHREKWDTNEDYCVTTDAATGALVCLSVVLSTDELCKGQTKIVFIF